MTPTLQRQVLLKARPTGIPQAEDFEIVVRPVSDPGDGQIVVRNHDLSVEPAMRGWVASVGNYAEPVPVGGVMRAFAVGRVVASRSPAYAVGDIVTGLFGWQEVAVVDAAIVQRRISGPPELAHRVGPGGLDPLPRRHPRRHRARPRLDRRPLPRREPRQAPDPPGHGDGGIRRMTPSSPSSPSAPAAPLRITVLGSGSVGLALAASYAHAGQRVALLARGSTVARLRSEGIAVSGVCGDHRIDPQRLKVGDADRPDAEDIACDVLIVATKAYQVGDALASLMRHAPQDSTPSPAPKAVLLIQNGWGSADEARAVLPPGVPVFSSIMMIGMERRSPVHVNVNVQASPIRVGTVHGAAPEPMQDAVRRGEAGFLPITYEHPVEPAILNKFLFNTCMNAVGALTRMTYGELVSNAHTRHLIKQVADETIRVLRAERQADVAAAGDSYVERTLTPFVLPRGAAHRSSMLQDVEAGRRTEIDYLNGAVVRMGQRHGIATPANDAVASLVRASETRRST